MKEIILKFLFLFLCAGVFAQVDLTSNLLLYCKFNGDASDYGPNNLDGTTRGATPCADRYNKADNAYYLDGNDTISFSSDARFNVSPTSHRTFAFWIKAEGLTSAQSSILSKYQHWNNESNFYIFTRLLNSTPMISFSGIGNNILEAQYQQNTWQFITITVDGPNSQTCIYVNGVKRAEGNVNLNNANCSLPMNVGLTTSKYGSADRFKGSVDELRLYDRVLSGDEINTLFAQGALAFLSPLENDVLMTNQNITIRWYADPDTFPQVNLDYSTDNGSTWNNIASNQTGSSYAWTTPGTRTVNLKLRLSKSSDVTKAFIAGNISVLADSSEVGLQGYYKFSNNLNDQSVYNRTATGTSTTFTTDSWGNTTSAINFNGTNSYVQMPSFQTGNEFSVSAWIYCRNINASYSRIIDFGDGTGNNNILLGFCNTTGNMFAEVYDGGTGGPQLVTTETFPQNTWVYVTYTNNNKGEACIYWNGKKQNTTGSNRSIKAITRTYHYLGKSLWNGDAYFDGIMDEVKIFNKALSQNDIDNIYFEQNKLYITSHLGFVDVVALQSDTIKWRKDPSSSFNVDITYSLDNKATWNTVATNVTGEKYAWQILSAVGSNLYIRITNSSNASQYCTSDSIHIVADSLNVGLIAYYPFNGATNDSSFYKRNATGSNLSYSSNRLGRPNTAVDFNNASSQITCPSFTFGQAFTLSTWVYCRNVHADYARIIDFGNGTPDNNIIIGFQGTTGKLFFETYRGTTSNWQSTDEIFPENKWVHVVCINDGKGKAKIYINGNKQLEFAQHAPILMSRTTQYIGKSMWSGNAAFDGLMDEMHIYRRALTESEITQLYSKGSDLSYLCPKPYSTLLVNSPCNISWYRNRNTVNAVNLEYTTNSTTWNTIATNLTRDTFAWTTPAQPAKVLKFRISDVADSSMFVISDTISIVKDPLEIGLIASFPFDGNTNDTTLSRRNAAGTNLTYVTDRFGRTGKCADLNGSNAYIALPDFRIAKPFTISAWVKCRDIFANYTRIFDLKSNSTSTNILTGFYGTTGKGYIYSSASGSGAYGPTKDTFPANTWVHVVYSYDGQNAKLYWNNQLETVFYQVGINDVFFNSNYLGKSNVAGDPLFNGLMDDVKIYNRSLSFEEIKILGIEHINLKITSPEPKTSLATGKNIPIRWKTNPDSVAKVNLYYSLDNGVNWTLIASDLTTESYSWQVVGAPTRQLRFKLVNADKTTQYDISDIMRISNNKLDEGLEVYLPFDGNTNDSTEKYNPKSYNVSYIADRFKHNDHGANFDSAALSINMLHPSNKFSWCYWINTSHDYSDIDATLMGYSRTWMSMGYEDKKNAGKVVAEVYDHVRSRYDTLSSSNNINDGKWHFVSLVCDSISASLYVDGKLDKTIAGTYINDDYDDYYLGGYYYWDNTIEEQLYGKLDEVRLYNRALSPGEIMELNCMRPDTLNSVMPASVCSGQNVTLTATGNALQYNWNNDITNGTPFIPAETKHYIVSAQFEYGCQKTDSTLVTVHPKPVNFAGRDSAICKGNPVTLNATSVQSISWNNGLTNGASVTPSATTTYIATGTDDFGCTNSDSVTIRVNELPINFAGRDSAICKGNSITLNATSVQSISWNNGLTNGASVTPLVTTTYIATGTNNFGCTNSDSVTITVNDLPIVFAGEDQSVIAGNTVTLTASGAAIYTWNNNVVNGQSFSPSETKTYTVTGISDQGCSATDEVLITVTPATGIVDASQVEVRWYPNPVTDKLYIHGSKVISAVTLINYSGAEILHMPMSSTDYVLPMNNYPQGVYLIKLTVDNQTYVYKVIKK